MGLLEPHGRGRRLLRVDALRRVGLTEARLPVIVVYSLTQAAAALSAAVEMGQAVNILSAADAGISAGAGWWVALLAAAREAIPSAEFSAILDCGDDAGAAQAALRAGVEAIVFTGRADVAARLAEIGAASGARLLAARPATDIDLTAEFFADAATLRRRCLTAFDPQKT